MFNVLLKIWFVINQNTKIFFHSLLITLIVPAAQLSFILTGREWSFGYNIIALDLTAFNVSFKSESQLESAR